jgi:hypothetical protein
VLSEDAGGWNITVSGICFIPEFAIGSQEKKLIVNMEFFLINSGPSFISLEGP